MENRDFWKNRHEIEMKAPDPYGLRSDAGWKNKLPVLYGLDFWVREFVFCAMRCFAANDPKMALKNLDRAIENFDFLIKHSAFSEIPGKKPSNEMGEAISHIFVRWAKILKGNLPDNSHLSESIRLAILHQAALKHYRDDKEEFEFCQFMQLASAFSLKNKNAIDDCVNRSKRFKKYRLLKPELELMINISTGAVTDPEEWETAFRPLFNWWRSPYTVEGEKISRRDSRVFGWGFQISLHLIEIDCLIKCGKIDWRKIVEDWIS